MKRAIILIAMMLCCGQAGAQSVRVKQYLHPTKPEFKNFDKVFLAGVKDGLIAHSVFTDMEKAGRQLFCIPRNLNLTAEQAEDIMLRWVEKHKTQINDDTLVSMALLWGLEETFPCQK